MSARAPGLPSPATGPGLVTDAGLHPGCDTPSLAEYERLYAESCRETAALLRTCEHLGRKIGKIRTSVRWDLQQLVHEIAGDRRR